MNVAIISFQDNTDIIGAKYIHAYIRSHGHKSYLILQREPDYISDDSIFRFLNDNNIDIVGVSLMSHEFFRARAFAKAFKSRSNDIPLVFGGIHATIAPEECLSVADIVVRGEGEDTFLELIRHLEEKKDYSNLSGICLKDKGHVKYNPLRMLETDLDRLPFPKHLPEDMYIVHKKNVLRINKKLFMAISRYAGKFPNIITTRGCPFSCTYCCNSALKELYEHYPIRKRTVGSVISEVSEIISEHRDCFLLNIQDDCFLSYDNDWFAEFSRQYSSKIRLPFVARTTPRHINRQNIALLKEAGLAMVMMGLQSGSDRVNKEIYRRNVTNDAFLTASNIIKDSGLAAYYDVILDNPYETEDDILKTMKVISQIPKPFQLQLFSLCMYQGTELYKRAIREGVLFMDPRMDDYGRLSPTTLNKLVQITPTIPTPIVERLTIYRNNVLAVGVINILALLNIIALKPMSFLILMHRACGANLRSTSRLVRYFYRTALDKILKR